MIKRLLLSAGFALSLGLAPALASQAPITTPTAGPMSMATFTGTYLNPALLAITSCFSGASAPTVGVGSTIVTYQCWINTTTNPSIYEIYDGAQWLAIGTIDTSAHVWVPSGAGNVSNSGTPTSGQIGVWASASALAGITLAGDCTFSSPNITCTKTNGTAFSVFATAAAASKSDQQTGTSNVLPITPLHQQDHNSAIKAHVNFVGATAAINKAYNVGGGTPVSRSATGVYVINFVTPFASTTSYGCRATAETTLAIAAFCFVLNASKTASSIPVDCLNGSTLAATDPAAVDLECTGDQ